MEGMHDSVSAHSLAEPQVCWTDCCTTQLHERKHSYTIAAWCSRVDDDEEAPEALRLIQRVSLLPGLNTPPFFPLWTLRPAGGGAREKY